AGGGTGVAGRGGGDPADGVPVCGDVLAVGTFVALTRMRKGGRCRSLITAPALWSPGEARLFFQLQEDEAGALWACHVQADALLQVNVLERLGRVGDAADLLVANPHDDIAGA